MHASGPRYWLRCRLANFLQTFLPKTAILPVSASQVAIKVWAIGTEVKWNFLFHKHKSFIFKWITQKNSFKIIKSNPSVPVLDLRWHNGNRKRKDHVNNLEFQAFNKRTLGIDLSQAADLQTGLWRLHQSRIWPGTCRAFQGEKPMGTLLHFAKSATTQKDFWEDLLVNVYQLL
jgi:hypothetical protein